MLFRCAYLIWGLSISYCAAQGKQKKGLDTHGTACPCTTGASLPNTFFKEAALPPLQSLAGDHASVLVMKQCMDGPNLHRRLKKIIGQVEAINRMVDEDVPCEDILAQVNAAKSALHRVGQVILEGHIRHCVRDGIEHGDAEKTIANFTKAVERFANM